MKDKCLKYQNGKNKIITNAIKNLKSDINIVKNFKAYLEKEDYENLSEYLESFFEKELNDKKERLRKVEERFEKVKSEGVTLKK